jgi:hypothetical protein
MRALLKVCCFTCLSGRSWAEGWTGTEPLYSGLKIRIPRPSTVPPTTEDTITIGSSSDEDETDIFQTPVKTGRSEMPDDETLSDAFANLSTPSRPSKRTRAISDLKNWSPPSIESAYVDISSRPNVQHGKRARTSTSASNPNKNKKKSVSLSASSKKVAPASSSKGKQPTPEIPEEHIVPVKRPRGRPPGTGKLKQGLSEPMPVPSYIRMYTEVELPKILQRGKTARGNKMVNQTPRVDGPVSLSLDANWGDFIDSICTQLVRCKPEQLILPSMRFAWHTLRKRSNDQYPVQNPNGYEQMMNLIKRMPVKDIGEGMLYIYMSAPRPLDDSDSRVCQPIHLLFQWSNQSYSLGIQTRPTSRPRAPMRR